MIRRVRKRSFFSRLNATNTIIAINIAVFVFVSVAIIVSGFSHSSFGDTVVSYTSLNPQLFVHGYFWTLVTSMFTHFSFSHLLVNMISLFFIGMFVERLIGRRRYVWFYLVSGLAAGLLFVALTFLGNSVPYGSQIFGTPDLSAVGASGAIFGLAGLLVILLPELRVLVFFIIPMPMWLAMVVLIFGLWALSIAINLPIGNTAHLGGLLVGIAYGIYLRLNYPQKIKMLNKMFRT